jgi:hypothetical protein
MCCNFVVVAGRFGLSMNNMPLKMALQIAPDPKEVLRFGIEVTQLVAFGD